MRRRMIVMVVVAMDAPPASDSGSLIAFVRVAGLTFLDGRNENVTTTDTLPSGDSFAVLSSGCVMAFDATSLCMAVVGEFRVDQPPVRYIGIPDAPVDNRLVLFRTLVAIEGVA